MPELERYILHRMSALDAKLRAAVESYDWTGVYPEIHNFCATDLSAFYFDIRKDAIYCDRPDSLRRRGARTVLDHLHRCLCTWLAPVLCFTAEEAWTARIGEQDSVHLAFVPDRAARLARRRAGRQMGDSSAPFAAASPCLWRRPVAPMSSASSLQAAVTLKLAPDEAELLNPPNGPNRHRVGCSHRGGGG